MFTFCICHTLTLIYFFYSTLPRFTGFYLFLPHALVSGFSISWFYLTSPLMIPLFVYLTCDCV